MKKIGSVNPCNMMFLFDKNGKEIGTCMDTPNSFAVACVMNSRVAYGKAHYQFFGTTVRKRDEKDNLDRVATYRNRRFESTKEEYDRLKQYVNFR